MNLLRLLILFLFAFCTAPAAAKVSAGTLVDLGVLQSKFADARRVTVWLPSGYDQHGPKYSVLYMHDGQNLFDKDSAGYGMEWQIDETLDRLIREKAVRPTIVVGIWNTPKRLREYVPAKVVADLPSAYADKLRALYGGGPLSDGYLKFIVEELRPMIDGRFNVNTDRADTVIMGSSMGGLISLYAINEYPDVFGGAGMMSTHWPLFLPTGEDAPISEDVFEPVSSAFERYVASSLPDPKTHRLYFDHGDQTLDVNYAPYQQRIDKAVAARGYRKGINWLSLTFPGDAHNEASWASRVEIPLRFLLPATGAKAKPEVPTTKAERR